MTGNSAWACLRSYIEEKGITQEMLCRRLVDDGLDIDTVKLNLILNGKRQLTTLDLEAICHVLGIPRSMLLRMEY